MCADSTIHSFSQHNVYVEFFFQFGGSSQSLNALIGHRNEAYLADAIAALIGSMLGVSTVATFAESTAGVADGAKTGMASLTTGLCFLLAIPIAPVVSAVPPLASGPILCLLGALMCSSVRGINWDDFEESMPAFVAMVTMPYTFSIGYGIIAGLLLWSLG